MIKTNRFNNNPDEVNRHTSVFASAAEENQTVPNRKSFEARLMGMTGGDPRLVKGYRHSRIAQSHGVRDTPKKPTIVKNSEAAERAKFSRQAKNSGNNSPESVKPPAPRQQRTFTEPTPRGYNPLG